MKINLLKNFKKYDDIKVVIVLIILIIIAITSIAILMGNGSTQAETTEDIKIETSEVKVPIPQDAKYISGTEDTGIVIEYKGSEFVWVPIIITDNNELCPKGTTKPMAKLKENGIDYEGILYQNFNLNLTENDIYNENLGPREPDILSEQDTEARFYNKILGYNTLEEFKQGMQNDYNEMIESVKKYGGFFVGRYETSVDGEKVASKKGVMPMTSQTASGNMWYGMYDKQKKFTTSSDTMVSSMIWGSQYDAMINWMLVGKEGAKVEQYTNGNHTNEITNSGSFPNDKINNIYDLEGNLYEWTLEADYTKFRTRRGGYIKLSDSPSKRNEHYIMPNFIGNTNGSRMTLYIK